jgi:membrane protease YdiL (CAAX protease family)
MQFLSKMLDECEHSAPKRYTGRFEGYFVFLSFIFFFLYRLIVLSQGARENWGAFVLDLPVQQGIGYVLFDAIFSTIFYLSIVLFATNRVSDWIQQQLKVKNGLIFAIIVPVACVIYKLLGMLFGFPIFTQMWRPSVANIYWSGSPWIIPVIGGSVALFIAIRTSILFGQIREDRRNLLVILKENFKKSKNLGEFGELEQKFVGHFLLLLGLSPLLFLNLGIGWLALLGPVGIFLLYSVAKLPVFNQNPEGFTIGDILTAGLGVGPVILCQSIFSLAWCFTLPVAAILVYYTTGFGREHFHFSFVPQKAEEVPELINTVLFAIITFIPIAIGIGFIKPATGWNPHVTGATLLQYIATWVYLVGISEEFIFRCGILILLADAIRFQAKKHHWGDKPGLLQKIAAHPMFTAMVLAAIIFGLAHAPKGWDYAFLAILAGFIYGLPFVKNKSLFGAVMLHAIVDVIAVAYFSAQL